jgi:glycerol-3-phosphate acyltransferase PlsY
VRTLPSALSALAVTCAAIGHMYTPWLKFKGGKGMATVFGGTLAVSWPVGIVAMIVWLLTFLFKNYVSLASVAALVAIPFLTLLRIDGPSAFILAIACAVAIWRHRENIKRLRQGTEPRMKFGKENNA